MCIGGGTSSMPAAPPIVPPPAPPSQITIAAPPPLMIPSQETKRTQFRPDNPVRKRRGQSRRGKSMLKIPMNAPNSRSVNV